MENQIVITNKGNTKMENLIKASLQLFNTKGFHQTRIEDIIKVAGVGKGTFYLYFKNKEDVVFSVLDQFLSEITNTLDWVQLNIEDVSSLRNLFLEEAEKLTKTFIDNQEAARFLFREGRAVGREVEDKINEHINKVITDSKETYEFAIGLGILKNINAEVAAMTVVGGISQIYHQWLEGEIEGDLNEVIESTVDFYLAGLGLTSTS